MRAVDIHATASLVAAVGLDRCHCVIACRLPPPPFTSPKHTRLLFPKPHICCAIRFLHVFDFDTRRLTFRAYLKQRLNTVRDQSSSLAVGGALLCQLLCQLLCAGCSVSRDSARRCCLPRTWATAR